QPINEHSAEDNITANQIISRFPVPEGFERSDNDSSSFAVYLRKLPLKPYGETVRYYNGVVKPAENVYCAVVNMDIGHKDLQQCADAVMRLRAEYLYRRKKYADISFRFTGDGLMHDFKTYAKGD